MGDVPFYLKFWVKLTALKVNRRFSITLIGSPLRAFQSYVAPKSPKRSSITQNGRFRFEISLRLKKFCYNVYFYENCQRQSCKAFIGLTIRAKMISGATLLPEILGQTDRVEAKSTIFDIFSLVGPQP